MSSATEEYYQNITAGISQNCRELWEEEILVAEETRLENPTAMDVLAARIESAGSMLGETSHPPITLLDEAFNLALLIEEKQLSHPPQFLKMIDQLFRLEVQVIARRSVVNPTEDNNSLLLRLRDNLAAQFSALDSITSKTDIVLFPGQGRPFDLEGLKEFDHLDDDVSGDALSAVGDSEMPTIEHRRLPLPSYHNAGSKHAGLELRLREMQADRLLDSIRSSVAEKSFQYSHVIRKAPRKGVNTRARSVIGKINSKIAGLCTAYNRCQSAMIRLGADEETLGRFKHLVPADVKASTAMLDPNTPGASSLRLSWIWEIHSRIAHSSSPDSLLECVSSDHFYYI